MTKKSVESDIARLHLYAQDYSHSETYIIGNIAGLRELRDALTRVLESKIPDRAIAYAADGEGYNILLVPTEDAVFTQSMLPYTDPSYCIELPIPTPPKSGKHPYEIISKTDYLRLTRP